MGAVINTGRDRIAQAQGAAEVLTIDRFVFAYIDGLDHTAEVNLAEPMPAAEDIVHIENVSASGYVAEDRVVYSCILGASVGDFDFNWIGLQAQDDTLIAVSYTPTQNKYATAGLAVGNTLTRNFLIQYDSAQETSGIVVEAGVWQIDFMARLDSQDEHHRKDAETFFGDALFINDGLLVTSDGSTVAATAGYGYLGGYRVSLDADTAITVSELPKDIYLDAALVADAAGSQIEIKFTASPAIEPLENYVDDAGDTHYLTKIASVASNHEVTDYRKALSVPGAIIDALLNRENHTGTVPSDEVEHEGQTAKDALDARTPSYESVQSFVESSPPTYLQRVAITSYHPGWAATRVGPKGGFYAHKTGADHEAPTLGAPVVVSTIGTGTQAGYFWDASGAEWVISKQPYNVCMFGARGTGLVDDQPSCQDAYRFLAGRATENNYKGIDLVFPPPEAYYRFDSTLETSDRAVNLRGGTDFAEVMVRPNGGFPALTITNTTVDCSVSGLYFYGFANEGQGIYITGNSRKIHIHNNAMQNLDIGIQASGAWTLWINHNRIQSNRIGILCLKRTDTLETTTVYIHENSIFSNSEYNIAWGLQSEPFAATGTSVAVGSICDNMLDDGRVYITNTSKANIGGTNYAEGHSGESGPLLTLDGDAGFVWGVTVRGYYFRTGHKGIRLIGANFRKTVVEENYFTQGVYVGIDARSARLDGVKIGKNFYQASTINVEYPRNSSTGEIAENLTMEMDDYDSCRGGVFEITGTALPTSGRYKNGTVYVPRNTDTDQRYVYKGDPTGWTRAGSLSDIADVNATTNVVGPDNIDRYLVGDLINIQGAGAAGADLDCTVTSVDYEGGTFTVTPNPSTDVTNNTVTFKEGEWIGARQISKDIPDGVEVEFPIPYNTSILNAVGFNSGRSALLYYKSGSTVANFGGGADIAVGTTSDPGTASKINIWAGSGVLKVVNRLGFDTDLTVRYAPVV